MGRHRKVSTEVFDDPTVGAGPGQPGRLRRTGARSPLIRTRRDDVRWVLGSKPVRAALVMVLVACVVWPTYTLAWPVARAWWEDTTNPEIPTPTPSVTVTYVETDGTPVLYGVDDVTVKFGADFDPLDGVTALDVEDGDITDSIRVTGEVDTEKAGEVQLTYRVRDSYGNLATAERTVTVKPEPTKEPTQDPDPEPTTTRPPQPTQNPTTRPPQPPATQDPTTRPPQPTQNQTTKPPATARVSTSLTVTCSGPATVTVTATGGGNVQLSGAASGSGGTSVTKSVTTNGGRLSFTATADKSVNISYGWSGTGPCSG